MPTTIFQRLFDSHAFRLRERLYALTVIEDPTFVIGKIEDTDWGQKFLTLGAATSCKAEMVVRRIKEFYTSNYDPVNKLFFRIRLVAKDTRLLDLGLPNDLGRRGDPQFLYDPLPSLPVTHLEISGTRIYPNEPLGALGEINIVRCGPEQFKGSFCVYSSGNDLSNADLDWSTRLRRGPRRKR